MTIDAESIFAPKGASRKFLEHRAASRSLYFKLLNQVAASFQGDPSGARLGVIPLASGTGIYIVPAS